MNSGIHVILFTLLQSVYPVGKVLYKVDRIAGVETGVWLEMEGCLIKIF
jgi:hypothetical protein